jgi:hypothetical protein
MGCTAMLSCQACSATGVCRAMCVSTRFAVRCRKESADNSRNMQRLGRCVAACGPDGGLAVLKFSATGQFASSEEQGRLPSAGGGVRAQDIHISRDRTRPPQYKPAIRPRRPAGPCSFATLGAVVTVTMSTEPWRSTPRRRPLRKRRCPAGSFLVPPPPPPPPPPLLA